METSCDYSSYTESYSRHLVIFDSKTVTKLLLASQTFDGVADVRMSPGFVFSKNETLLYLLGTGCGSSSYTQSYTSHIVIFYARTLTKLLIASQSFDGVAEVRLSLWLCIV